MKPMRPHAGRIGIIVKCQMATTGRTCQLKVCLRHLRCTRYRSRSWGGHRAGKRSEADTNTHGEYGRADRQSKHLNFVRANSSTQRRGCIRTRAGGNLTLLEAPGPDTGFTNMAKLPEGWIRILPEGSITNMVPGRENLGLENNPSPNL